MLHLSYFYASENFNPRNVKGDMKIFMESVLQMGMRRKTTQSIHSTVDRCLD